jgi:hypothetical protein
MTIDPDLAETDQAYAYAGDDPVNRSDPTGDFSLGICAGFETHIAFLQLGAGDCLTEIRSGSNTGQIGIVGTALTGLGLGLGVGLQFYVQVSNADNLNQLGSWFTYFAASAALGGGILGGDVGIEAGALVSGALGESYTWVKVISGWFGVDSEAARGAFDILEHLALPAGFNPRSELDKAKTIADKYHSGQGQLTCAP